MSEYTPITTDMRLLAGCFTGLTDFERDRIAQLCDVIDSVHAQLERENAALKAELDRVLGEDDRDGWIELPKDADGKHIRIGDVMEWFDGETFEVVGIGDGMLFYVKDGHEQADWTGASTKRHHQPDTWERIIEDARTCTGSTGNYTSVPTMRWTNEIDALVARCNALCERTKEDA